MVWSPQKALLSLLGFSFCLEVVLAAEGSMVFNPFLTRFRKQNLSRTRQRTRGQQNGNGRRTNGKKGRSGEGRKPGEDLKFYLLARSAVNCLPRNHTETINISPDDFVIFDSKTRSKVIEFPGCFEIETRMEVFNTSRIEHLHDPNLMAYQEWEWMQAPAHLRELQIGCKGTKPNGCDGEGNRCYYCDMCDGIREYSERNKLEGEAELKCPDKPGDYLYKSKRCINDWGSLDKDKDGEPDFLSDPQYKDLREIQKATNIHGFGSMRLHFELATSATPEQHNLMEKDRAGLSQREWNHVHRTKWLPRLVNENVIACVNVFFDICERRPNPHRLGSLGSC